MQEYKRVNSRTVVAVGSLHEAPDQMMIQKRKFLALKRERIQECQGNNVQREKDRKTERKTTMSDPERESDVVLVRHVLLMSCHTAVLYLIPLYLDSEQAFPVSPGDLDPL